MTDDDLTDEQIEAKGAMLHAMSTRDYHREQANDVERLKADVARLTQLLNDGHKSLTEENEALRWACAQKDAAYAVLAKERQDISASRDFWCDRHRKHLGDVAKLREAWQDMLAYPDSVVQGRAKRLLAETAPDPHSAG